MVGQRKDDDEDRARNAEICGKLKEKGLEKRLALEVKKGQALELKDDDGEERGKGTSARAEGGAAFPLICEASRSPDPSPRWCQQAIRDPPPDWLRVFPPACPFQSIFPCETGRAFRRSEKTLICPQAA